MSGPVTFLQLVSTPIEGGEERGEESLPRGAQSLVVADSEKDRSPPLHSSPSSRSRADPEYGRRDLVQGIRN